MFEEDHQSFLYFAWSFLSISGCCKLDWVHIWSSTHWKNNCLSFQTHHNTFLGRIGRSTYEIQQVKTKPVQHFLKWLIWVVFLRWNNMFKHFIMPHWHFMSMKLSVTSHNAQEYNKNKWVITMEIMLIVFCIGIIHESTGLVKYPYQKQWTPNDHHKFVLVFMLYYYWFDIDFNVLYNFKEFTMYIWA